MIYQNYIKRQLDIIVSVLLLLILLPVFVIIMILLLFQNNGKVFFIQKRPGYKEEPFYLIKFKTMTDKKDRHGNFLPDNQRITEVGNWIRKLSIDEIPQLINVIKGDMSLIGPRPLLFKYIPIYSDIERRRHDVRPGITGWAQINGRNALSWKEKFHYDIYYVENLSFLLDLKIFMLTIKKTIIREGINQSDSTTMEPYNGTN